MNIVISSGHGKIIRGAAGYIDEVDEARKVVNRVASYLNNVGVDVEVFHDDISKSQDENLNRIVNFHNSKNRDLDVSVHFNANEITDSPMGTECLYVTQEGLARTVAEAISYAGSFKNRGPKKRDDLFFLNHTDQPSILIEVCFVDSQADVDLYHEHFEAICSAVSGSVSGIEQPALPESPDIFKPGLLSELLTIGSVTIQTAAGGRYVRFTSDLDICNDGTGPSHGDPYHQSETAYYNDGDFLNADKDKYIVIPPQIRSMVPGVVMGCRGRLTNLKTGICSEAVVGEIGPDDKTGEAAYCLAKIINPAIDYNSGDTSKIYLYELWPDVPAVVDAKTYELEPA